MSPGVRRICVEQFAATITARRVQERPVAATCSTAVFQIESASADRLRLRR
jgi:hypothetical protein